MERRDVLKKAQRAGLGALCISTGSGLLMSCSSVKYVASQVEGDRLVISRTDVDAAPFVLVRNPTPGEAPIYLHRTIDGSFAAVLMLCTHQGCRLNPAGAKLACPCHGSEFTPTGEVMEGPAEEPLHSYAVSEEADRVIIHLS